MDFWGQSTRPPLPRRVGRDGSEDLFPEVVRLLAGAIWRISQRPFWGKLAAGRGIRPQTAHSKLNVSTAAFLHPASQTSMPAWSIR